MSVPHACMPYSDLPKESLTVHTRSISLRMYPGTHTHISYTGYWHYFVITHSPCSVVQPAPTRMLRLSQYLRRMVTASDTRGVTLPSTTRAASVPLPVRTAAWADQQGTYGGGYRTGWLYPHTESLCGAGLPRQFPQHYHSHCSVA